MKIIPSWMAAPSLAVGVSVILAACSTTSSSSPATSAAGTKAHQVNISVPSVAVPLPVLVAQQEGYFRQQHLKVAITKLVNLTQLVPALVKDQYNIGITTATNLITARSAHIALVAVSGDTVDSNKTPPTAEVVVKASSSLHSLRNLGDKTIGVSSITANTNIALEYKLQQLGVTGVHFIQIAYPNMLGQLQAGRVNAVVPGTPYLEAFQSPSYHFLGDPNLFLPIPNVSAIWVSSQQWAETHQQALAAFRAAINQAIHFIPIHTATDDKLLAQLSGIGKNIISRSPLPVFSSAINARDFELWLKAMNAVAGNRYQHILPSSLVLSG